MYEFVKYIRRYTIWTDSYRLSNGVIVISDQDYIKLLNNEIQIPIWEEK